MKKILLVLAFLFAAAVPAAAQGCGPQNPNCIVPTAPPGTSDNRAASTAFVENAVTAAPITSAQLDAICSTNNEFLIRVTGTWQCGTFSGQFSVGSTLSIASLAWSLITGTPTTLAGYGITNARPQLSNALTIYVNGNSTSATCQPSSATPATCAAGNDSNNCLTPATACLTLARGLIAARSVDEAGFQITIVLAYTTAGSAGALNYGGTFALGPAIGAQGPGGNALFITGDLNSPASVSITAPNTGLLDGIYASDGFVGRLSYVQLDNQSAASDGLRVGQMAIVDLLGVTCGASWTGTAGSCLYLEKGGVMNGAGSPMLTLAGCGAFALQMTGGIFNAADISNPGTPRTIAIPSAIACGVSTVVATGNSELLGFTNNTFTGSGVAGTTGTRAILAGAAYVNYSGASSVNSIFPGNVNATIQDAATTNHAGDTRTVPLPVASGGTGVSTTPGIQAIAAGEFINFIASGVNFNSANTDTAIPITLPTGYTRYIVFQVQISGASASISTATFGVFSAAGGTGTAWVASGTAISVVSASDATTNNYQSTNASAGSASFLVANTPNIYFRVVGAQGSPATANVIISVKPSP